MTEHAVVIAGGGPTGLMLAGELALAGVDCVVVERRRTQDVEGSRSLGLLSRTIEVLDQRGIADRFLDAGFTVPTHGYGGIRFDVTDLPTRHNYVLALPQKQFEPILADWVTDLGVQILRDRQVTGFVQHDAGVEIELSDDKHLRASYLVGCDGGRSLVRRTAGIDFAGLDPTTSWMIAEVTMDQEPELGFRHDGLGTHALARAADGDPVRVLLTEREVGHSTPPDLDDLRDALITVYGTDFGLRDATWISRFTDATRQAVTYRRGRVLLAGDAAHVHPPQGGQGMQTGIQDAVNLGWKLAQVVDGASAGEPARQLPRRAASGRRPGAAEHDGAGDDQQAGCPSPRSSRHHGRAADHGRTAQVHRCDAHRSGRSLRPRRWTPLDRAADARPRPAHPERSLAGLRRAARRPAGAAQFR